MGENYYEALPFFLIPLFCPELKGFSQDLTIFSVNPSSNVDVTRSFEKRTHQIKFKLFGVSSWLPQSHHSFDNILQFPTLLGV
jgi:hypothetical protein